jgi:2-polyprenyl-6-methoxyphenol hydroxylase-like FAD-dependent oxidoreductase
VADELRTSYADWTPQLLQLLEHIDPSTLESWSLHMIPLGFTWAHTPGAALIGDAAHLVPPFDGEGVKLELFDVRKLSKAIIIASASASPQRGNASSSSLDERVLAFEQNMLSTAYHAQRLANELRMCMMFQEGTPRTTSRCC